MVDARKHARKPIETGALDIISPVDSLEVLDFEKLYGADVKQALRRPRTVKKYVKFI